MFVTELISYHIRLQVNTSGVRSHNYIIINQRILYFHEQIPVYIRNIPVV